MRGSQEHGSAVHRFLEVRGRLRCRMPDHAVGRWRFLNASAEGNLERAAKLSKNS
jgi:hypothetical protein